MNKYFMAYKSPLFLSMLLISACSSTYEGRKICSFSFNGKNRNSYIANRFPDYGDGHKDGCVVMGEIRLEINRSIESSFDGSVFDATNNSLLNAANIYVYYKSSEQPKIMVTNEHGKFSFEKNDEVVKLKIEALGYRSLLLDFSEYHLL
jgi:hypothetical protein